MAKQRFDITVREAVSTPPPISDENPDIRAVVKCLHCQQAVTVSREIATGTADEIIGFVRDFRARHRLCAEKKR